MKRYNVIITGVTPMLHHWDNIEWADQMAEWKDDPANKKGSKAGDDRSPAWRWIGALYHDGEYIAIPADNIMTCLREGGAMVPVPGGKNGKTFKSQTQSGMMSEEPAWTMRFPNLVGIGPITALQGETDFKKHMKTVSDLGFSLSVKRAKIGMAKHVRVRPRFDNWTASGTLIVTDEQITIEVLRNIFAYAGRYKGLGDWRPGGKTPGQYGIFTAEITEA